MFGYFSWNAWMFFSNGSCQSGLVYMPKRSVAALPAAAGAAAATVGAVVAAAAGAVVGAAAAGLVASAGLVAAAAGAVVGAAAGAWVGAADGALVGAAGAPDQEVRITAPPARPIARNRRRESCGIYSSLPSRRLARGRAVSPTGSRWQAPGRHRPITRSTGRHRNPGRAVSPCGQSVPRTEWRAA